MKSIGSAALVAAALLPSPLASTARAQEPGDSPALAEYDLSDRSGVPSAGPNTEGFFLEFLGISNHVGEPEKIDDDANAVLVGENGPGGTLTLAYGFTPSFPLRLTVSGAEHNTTDPDVDVQFSSVNVEGGYIFRAGTSVRPYLYGGVGAYSAASDQGGYDYETTGPGIDIGFGLYSFLGDHFVIDAALRFDFINWETQTETRRLENGDDVIVETPVDEEGAASKILLGAGWWF